MEICHIEVFIRIVETFENWKFTGYVFSLLCLERVTLDLRKIPQSGDMSHCVFYWTLEIGMFRGYFLFFGCIFSNWRL